MSKFLIDLNINALAGFANGIAGIAGERIANAATDTVNAVAVRTYDLSRERMIAGINLTDAYLRQRMVLSPSPSGRAEASIVASGGRSDLSVLGRFDAKAKVVQNRSKGKRKGNRALGIAPGSKQQGVTVAVTRGSSKELAYGFILPLNKGTEAGGNGFGVFTRSKGSSRIRHRYGPSVYQLFGTQVRLLQDDISADLEQQLLKDIDLAINKAFE